MISFYQDEAGEHRWHILDDEDGTVIHACHEGFSSRNGALNNLFINNSLLSVFVARIARQDQADEDSANFEQDSAGKIRWRLVASNREIVGASHKGFGSMVDAVNNMMITHTMLTVFIAELAMARAADLHPEDDEDDDG